MKRPQRIRQHGLSLVELLLGLAITALVLAPLVPMLATTSAAARIGANQLTVEREADFALERIAARIRTTTTAAQLTGSSCAGAKSAAYDVVDGALVETVGKDKYVLAESVTCITLATLASSSERPLIQVSLNLSRDPARTAATAVVPLGVAP
jgi:Tfp pilus assembly protein PilW